MKELQPLPTFCPQWCTRTQGTYDAYSAPYEIIMKNRVHPVVVCVLQNLRGVDKSMWCQELERIFLVLSCKTNLPSIYDK